MNSITQSEGGITGACAASCQKVLNQIQKARASVIAQFRGLIADHDQALRLALNEAEALAWQTPYPQLVFPDLAEEKAQAVAAWKARQRLILERHAAVAA